MNRKNESVREHVPLYLSREVLFPGMLLPVHVDSSSALALFQRVLDTREELGVVPVERGNMLSPPDVGAVGTFARVVRMERLPDGSVHVHLRGTRRFRVREMRWEQAYPEATVEPVDDAPRNVLRSEALAARVRELWEMYTQTMQRVMGTEMREVRVPDDPRHLAYFVASGLQTDFRALRALLQLASVEDMLAREVALLAKELWLLDFIDRTQEREMERRLGPSGFLSRN